MSESKKTLITPEAILNWPAIFEPKMAPGATEAKYSCVLIFEQGTDLSALKAAAMEAFREKWGDKTKGLLEAGRLKSPFRNDSEEKGYPAGSVFLTATSKTPPGVVDRFAGPDGKPRPITDPIELYSGCKVRASISFYAYDTNGNKGVAVGLRNLQKLADGQRLDGRKKAQDEFDALEAGPAALADDLI